MNLYDLFMLPLERSMLQKIRKDAITNASGDVLEIGYGTGVNFRFYDHSKVRTFSALDVHHSAAAGTAVSQAFASEANQTVKIPVNFFEGSAESLPFADESFDTVVETLVFCSVDDMSAALNEVARVLKPGGRFIFMDHVLPEKRSLAALFKSINPLWHRLAGGCNLTREPHKLIESSGLHIEQSGSTGEEIFRWGIARKA